MMHSTTEQMFFQYNLLSSAEAVPTPSETCFIRGFAIGRKPSHALGPLALALSLSTYSQISSKRSRFRGLEMLFLRLSCYYTLFRQAPRGGRLSRCPELNPVALDNATKRFFTPFSFFSWDSRPSRGSYPTQLRSMNERSSCYDQSRSSHFERSAYTDR